MKRWAVWLAVGVLLLVFADPDVWWGMLYGEMFFGEIPPMTETEAWGAFAYLLFWPYIGITFLAVTIKVIRWLDGPSRTESRKEKDTRTRRGILGQG